MKRIILVALSLAISSMAVAANWVQVAEGVNSAQYYIDVDSRTYFSKQNTATVWIKGEGYYTPPKNPYSGEKGESSYKAKNTYYCATQQYKQLYLVTYDANGVNLKTVTKPSEIMEVVPDSITEAIYQFACKKK